MEKGKREGLMILSYMVGILLLGVVIIVALYPYMSFFSYFFAGGLYFTFLGIPLMDMEGRDQAQRAAQSRERQKNAYRRKRHWE